MLRLPLHRQAGTGWLFLIGLLLSLPLCLLAAQMLSAQWAQGARRAELDEAERQLERRQRWAEAEMEIFLATRRALPALLAQDLRLQQRLQQPNEPALHAAAQAYLGQAAPLGRVEALWLVDANGRSLSRSPGAAPDSGLRPAQLERLQVGLPVQQYLPATEPTGAGLLHAAALRDANGQVLGAVVAKVGMALVGKRLDLRQGYVSDAAGVVLLASNPAWQGRVLPGAPLWQMEAAERQRRYGRSDFAALPLQVQRLEGRELLRLGEGPLASERRLQRAQEGFTLHLLQPLSRLDGIAAAQRQRFWILLGVGLLLASLMLAGALHWWRGRQHARQMRDKNEALATLNEQLALQALSDPLTGCANRRRLMQLLDCELQRARRHPTRAPLALALLDLDHFKSVNDRHGHQIGDQALCHVAQLLGNAVRGSDLLARVGGEEFVLVMLDTPLHAAQALLERLRQRLQETPLVLAGGAELNVTVSIGLSALVIGDSADDLLARADLALYAAKRAGRNRLSLQSAPLRQAEPVQETVAA